MTKTITDYNTHPEDPSLPADAHIRALIADLTLASAKTLRAAKRLAILQTESLYDRYCAAQTRQTQLQIQLDRALANSSPRATPPAAAPSPGAA